MASSSPPVPVSPSRALTVAALVTCTAIVSPLAAQTVREVPGDRASVLASYAPVVDKASPAVVNIFTIRDRSRRQSPFAGDPFFRRFFDQFGGPGLGGRAPRQSALGSGVIIDPRGIIVTSNHVVENADELHVVLSDRREFRAELLLADARTDLAILRLAADRAFPVMEIADTRDLRVGDLVLAIGNPFGVGQTVTGGIVSALARTDVGVSDFSFFIQTDAAINPGNSGGALVDMHGRLVGVNTAIFSRSGGSNGIGFAIPSEMVRRLADAALSDGPVRRSWLGLRGQDLNQRIADSLGVDRPAGVLVTEIHPDGPAARAGLRRGDLVTAFDGREVAGEKALKFLAATLAPGARVTLDIVRDGRELRVETVLAPPPGAGDTPPVAFPGRHPLAGARLLQLDPALAEERDLDPFATGVLVVGMAPGSLAASTGIRPGDIIVSLNGDSISDLDQLRSALARAPLRYWRVDIDRGGRRISLRARL